MLSERSRGQTRQEGILQEEIEIEDARKNPAAFKVLYERYYEKIFRFLYRRLEHRKLHLT